MTANAAAADLHSVASCSYDAFFLLQDLVVLAEGGQEDEGGDVLETVNPLPPLRFLAAHVHDSGRNEELERVREQEEVLKKIAWENLFLSWIQLYSSQGLGV